MWWNKTRTFLALLSMQCTASIRRAELSLRGQAERGMRCRVEASQDPAALQVPALPCISWVMGWGPSWPSSPPAAQHWHIPVRTHQKLQQQISRWSKYGTYLSLLIEEPESGSQGSVSCWVCRFIPLCFLFQPAPAQIYLLSFPLLELFAPFMA